MKIIAAIIAIAMPAVAAAATITLNDVGIKCTQPTTEQKLICDNSEYTGIFKVGGGRAIIIVPHSEVVEDADDINHLTLYLQDRSSQQTTPLKLCMDESIDMNFTNELKPAGKYTSCTDSLDFMTAQNVHFNEKAKVLRVAGPGACDGYGIAYYKLDVKNKKFDLTAYLTQTDCDNPGYAATSPDIAIYERSIGATFPKLP